jgi:hypothetical protein
MWEWKYSLGPRIINLVLDVGKWSHNSRLLYIRREITRQPLDRKLGEPQNRFACCGKKKKSLALSGAEPRFLGRVNPETSHYIAWDIPANYSYNITDSVRRESHVLLTQLIVPHPGSARFKNAWSKTSTSIHTLRTSCLINHKKTLPFIIKSSRAINSVHIELLYILYITYISCYL